MGFGNGLTDDPMHFLSLFRRGGFTRTDRPNRLVSDNDTFRVCDCQTIQPFDYLAFYHVRRAPRFPLIESFTDAYDRDQTGLDCRFRLCVHARVGLAVMLTT